MLNNEMRLMFFTAIAFCAALAVAKAQDPAGPAELHFRRVYAPADRMKDWPTGEGKYLPLESDEFQRLLGLVQSGTPEDRSSFVSRIVAAEYQAELSGEQLLKGRATLEITHSGKSAGMMSLEPCNAAISKTAWDLPGKDPKTELKKPLLGSGAAASHKFWWNKAASLFSIGLWPASATPARLSNFPANFPLARRAYCGSICPRT